MSFPLAPEAELAELASAYVQRGMDENLAHEVAVQLYRCRLHSSHKSR